MIFAPEPECAAGLPPRSLIPAFTVFLSSSDKQFSQSSELPPGGSDYYADMHTGRSTETKSATRVLAVVLSAGLLCQGGVTRAQTPARGGSQPPAPGAGRGAAPASTSKVDANLLQLMRGILYPASNVLFAAQDDLSKLTPVADPSVSPNPLTSTYGGWQAVENAGLAIAEAANLIALPGRLCANGKPVPVQRADWVKYTQGLRTVGLAAYKAAQSKDQDKMVEVAGSVSDACAACHDVYREKKNGDQDRCLP